MDKLLASTQDITHDIPLLQDVPLEDDFDNLELTFKPINEEELVSFMYNEARTECVHIWEHRGVKYKTVIHKCTDKEWEEAGRMDLPFIPENN